MARARHWRNGPRGKAILEGSVLQVSAAAEEAEQSALVAHANRRRVQRILMAGAGQARYRHWSQDLRGGVLLTPQRALAYPHWSMGARGAAILTPQQATGPDLGKSPSEIASLWAYYTADGAHYQEKLRINPTVNDGERVGSFTDEGGSARHLDHGTQPLATCPLLKLNIQNGLPAVRFAGTDDRLFNQQALPQPCTVFVVANITGSGSASHCLTGSQTPFCLLGQSMNTAGSYGIAAGAGAIEFIHTVGSPHIYEHVLDGANTLLILDGVEKASGTAGTNGINDAAGGDFNVGARLATTYNLVGDIFAVVYYNANVSAADRASLRTWLALKWGITL